MRVVFLALLVVASALSQVTVGGGGVSVLVGLPEQAAPPAGFSPAPTNEWLISEGSGQTTDDNVGSNDGQLGSTAGADSEDPTWITGGLDFPANDYVVMGSSLQPDFLATAHTFCAFIEMDVASGLKGFLGEWDSPGWFLSHSASAGYIAELLIRNTTTTNELRTRWGGRTATTGTKYFVCASLPADPTIDASSFFIDAALDDAPLKTTDTFSSNPDYTGTELRMGTLQASVNSDHKIYSNTVWVGTQLTHQQVYEACDWYRDILVTQGLTESDLTCVPPPTHQWSFDSNSATETDDYGSNDCTRGAGQASPTWLNPGYRFSTNDNFNCGDLTDFNNGTGYSLCAMFDTDTINTERSMAGRTGTTSEFAFYLDNDELRTSIIGTGELDVETTTANLAQHTFYFGCWTIPPVTTDHGATTYSYIDGGAAETLTETTDTLTAPGAQTVDFLLAETNQSGSSGWDGDIHRIAVWVDHYLSEEEINALCWAWDGHHSITLNCN